MSVYENHARTVPYEVNKMINGTPVRISTEEALALTLQRIIHGHSNQTVGALEHDYLANGMRKAGLLDVRPGGMLNNDTYCLNNTLAHEAHEFMVRHLPREMKSKPLK